MIAPSTLRAKIVKSLRAQGFLVHRGNISVPKDLSKEGIRALHAAAVRHRVEGARRGLERKESRLLKHFASGVDIDANTIRPRLIEVLPDTEDELLFRYASLHWSIPVSAGYGRRLRFLVKDEGNGKLIGLIGLGDPVFGLRPRDQWIGWTVAERRLRLSNVMDAFVLGAVPPYSLLLGGKLVAMLVAADTVHLAFKRKYGAKRSLILNRVHDGNLALITTSSALGRSSIYNRLRYGERRLFQKVGLTQGFGEFHFTNGVYDAIAEYARRTSTPTAKQLRWGTGFRNRREVVGKCLGSLGISADWLNHGIKREVFVIPLAVNARDFLQRGGVRLHRFHLTEGEIFESFRDRWMLPRLAWDERYKNWTREEWALWTEGGATDA